MRIFVVLLASALGVAPVLGATVDGRVTASVYAFEGAVTDSTTQDYLRSTGAVRLQISDLGHPGLSITSYSQSTTDLSKQSTDDPSTRFYSLFLRYKDSRGDLVVGRQHVWAGVGSGSIDGLRLDTKRSGVRLTLYGGALVPVDGYETNSLSDAYLWGIRLRTERLAGVRLSLSYADRQRDPIPYRNAGIYSGFTGRFPAIRRQLLGAEASRRFGPHALRGRLDYDLQNEELRRGEVSGRLGLTPTLSVQAGWRQRRPSVFAGSILSVFPSQGYDELSVRANYALSTDLTVSVDAATVIYDDDDTQRLGVSAAIGRHITIGLRRYQGYAGDTAGITGSINYPLTSSLHLRGSLDAASFERFAADDSDDLLTGLAGLTWRPSRTFSVDGQLQGLSNPAYDSDLRMLLRANYRFRR